MNEPIPFPTEEVVDELPQMIWIDPTPDGWKYGFPKLIRKTDDISKIIQESGYQHEYVLRCWEPER